MNAFKNISRYIASHPLTRTNQIDAWGRFVSWQIRSRLQEEIIVSWIAGQKLAVRRGMTGATGNVYAGLHEFTDMMLPLHFLREGDLFLDIGANVGSYTVLASGVRRSVTWAFEPGLGALRGLKRNIEINALHNLVTIHEIALSDIAGDVPFTVGQDTMNRVAAVHETNTRMVSCRRLDDVIGGHSPLMMKIDVEGHENAVILGAGTILAGGGLKVIALETLTPETEAMLATSGFERAYYDPFTRELRDRPSTPPASNAVLVRDREFVSARLKTAPAVTVLGHTI
jgi:FkbM family methyltransferase